MWSKFPIIFHWKFISLGHWALLLHSSFHPIFKDLLHSFLDLWLLVQWRMVPQFSNLYKIKMKCNNQDGSNYISPLPLQKIKIHLNSFMTPLPKTFLCVSEAVVCSIKLESQMERGYGCWKLYKFKVLQPDPRYLLQGA